MAYDTTEERLKVRGSEQITRDLKVNRDAFINGKAETGSIDDKGDLKVTGEILAGNDVTISGDLYVNGTEYINDAETAQTTDNYLVLRHNQTTPLGTGEYSGVAVHNYDTDKTATITTDKEGTWRVADNTETDTNYTNISYYDGTYYTGLTRTAATVISGMKTAFNEDELDESVYYNNSYYHFDGNNWFPVSLVDNKLTLGSAVTDSATITALNALTKEDLVYFRSLTITVINPVENQPLLTRAEANDLTGGQALIWDATNRKAVGKTIDTTVASGSSNLITSGAVSTCVTNAINALDVAEVGGTNKYISKICEKDGKITATAGTIDTAVTANSTNLITSGAVKTCVDNAIGALDVASVGGSGKYISAISETDGKITATASDIASTYSSSGTAPINGTGVNKALQTLDVASVGGAGKYISAISETDGKISASATSMDTAPTASSTKAVTSGGIKTAINTAETNAKNLANATGTLAIAHGGTGVTSQDKINCNIIADLAEGSSDVTDGTMFVSSYASDNGFADTAAVNKPYKRQFVHVWNYIKDKISSVLGLTATTYGGKAACAGQADKGKNGSDYCAFGSNAFNSTAFTTCTGTVTVSNKAAADSYTPIALCTGTTTVGKSTGCSLSFNTCTGVIVASCLSGVANQAKCACTWQLLGNQCYYLSAFSTNANSNAQLFYVSPIAYDCENKTLIVDKVCSTLCGNAKTATDACTACCLKDHGGCNTIFCWSGSNTTPTWVWGSSTRGVTCVYNPACFAVKSAGSATNSTCFNGCTFAQACTTIRSGLTSCTGTVTVANVASDATGTVGIALKTGNTTIGVAKDSQNLLYNVSNSQIIMRHPQGSSTDVARATYINMGSIYYCYTAPGQCAICGFTICAGRQSQCCHCWTFCENGYMYGNVCGTFSGTFAGTIENATNATNACNTKTVCITCKNDDHTYAILFADTSAGNKSIYSDYSGLLYNACCNLLMLGNNSNLTVYGCAYIQNGICISANCYFCGKLHGDVCGNVSGCAACAVCIPNCDCTCWYKIYVSGQ